MSSSILGGMSPTDLFINYFIDMIQLFILICLKEIMYGIKLPSVAPVQLVKAHTGPVYSVKFNRAG